MSRAINLRLGEDEARQKCAAAGVSISLIEPLAGGRAHLLCATASGAEEIHATGAALLMAGRVRRTPFFRRPYSVDRPRNP